MSRKLSRYFSLVLVVAVFSVWFFVFAAVPAGVLFMHALDVGQGDAIFIETPSGAQMLIDGGPNAGVLSELSQVMPFYDRSIDIVVLTHPQDDHVFGLVDVLRRYKVDIVVLTGVDARNSAYWELAKIIKEKSIPVLIARAGQSIRFGDGVVADILYPFKNIEGKQTTKDLNDTSIALRLEFGEKSFLFMGDAEIQEEVELIHSKQNIDVDILKVNHHGSKTSTNELFLDAVTPDIALVSAGYKNRHGHPHDTVLKRLNERNIALFRTDLQGRITITTDGKQVSVTTEK